jgi:hypothetical protein
MDAFSGDDLGFHLRFDVEPPGPHIRSSFQLVLSPGRFAALEELVAAHRRFLDARCPPVRDWLLGDTDG